MNNIQTGSYIAYASLLVALMAHFGWILSTNDSIAIIAGVVAIIGTIRQHYITNKIAGISQGLDKKV